MNFNEYLEQTKLKPPTGYNVNFSPDQKARLDRQIANFEAQDKGLGTGFTPLGNVVDNFTQSLADKAIEWAKPSNYKDELKNAKNYEDVKDIYTTARANFDAASGFFGADKEQTNGFLKEFSSNLKELGLAQGLARDDDTGELMVAMDGEWKSLDAGTLKEFWASVKAHGGSAVGSLAGLFAKGGWKKKAVASTIGAAIGGGSDQAKNAIYADQPELLNTENAIKRGLTDGAINLGSELAVTGLIKGGQALANTQIVGDAMQTVGQRAQELKQMAMKAYENLKTKDLPLVDNVLKGNISGAEDVVYRTVGNFDKETARELAPELSDANPLLSKMSKKAEAVAANENNLDTLRAVSTKTQSLADEIAQKLANPALTQREGDLLAMARSNSSISPELERTIVKDPKVAQKFGDITENATAKFYDKTAHANHDADDVVKIFKDYEKRTKGEYKAVRDEFEKAAVNKTIQLDGDTLQSGAVEIAKSFPETQTARISAITKIASNEPLTIQNLFDARRAINSLSRKTDLHSVKQTLSDFKAIVDNGISRLSGADDTLWARLDCVDKSYSAMKHTMDDPFVKGLLNGIDKKAVATRLATKQRATNGAYYELTKGLSQSEREFLEKFSIDKAIQKHTLATDSGKRIVDYKALADDIGSLELKGEHANNIALLVQKYKQFHGEDIKMLKAINSAKVANPSAGIDSSFWGRIVVKIANNGAERLTAMLPFFEFAKTAALRQKLKVAILKARTPQELIDNFGEAVANSELKTSEKARAFNHLSRIEEADEALKAEINSLGKSEAPKIVDKAVIPKTIAEAYGVDYADFRGKGVDAVKHLKKVKNGSVKGAFYRPELGDIDVIWGRTWKEGKKVKGYGLAKIIKKHPEATPEFIAEVVAKGDIKPNYNGVNIKMDNKIVGLNRGWNINGKKIGDNHWVVTAFERK